MKIKQQQLQYHGRTRKKKKRKLVEFTLFCFYQQNHSCCCQRSFHIGRRADDERLLPCKDVGAEPGRERLLLLLIACEAEEGRLGILDFLSEIVNVEDIIAALDGRLGRRIRRGIGGSG
jgi:hypothetical protein